MQRSALAVIVLLALTSFSAGEQAKVFRRPKISDVFQAKVRLELLEDKMFWRGGGIWALNQHTHQSSLDVALANQSHAGRKRMHQITHNGESFSIEDRKCTPVTSTTDHPFSWLEQAKITTKETFLGRFVIIWELKNEDTVYTLAVDQDDYNHPVWFSIIRKGTNMTAEYSYQMTFLEFKAQAPSKTFFYKPNLCTPDLENLGDQNAVAAFANANWDCADPACDSTVPAGTGQPNYGCAEFAARSLAAGGYLPGIGPLDSQGDYYGWGYNGNSYDLCLTTGLASALQAVGFTQLSNDASNVDAGVAVFGDGGDGYFSHAAIGVSPGTVDAHNNARYQMGAGWVMANGIDALWGPSGSGGTGTTYVGAQIDRTKTKLAGGKGDQSIINRARQFEF